MIELNVVNEAEKIADSALYAGVSLLPKNGSALNKLVNTLSSFDDNGSNEEIHRQSYTAGSVDGTHDEVEAYIVNSLTRAMSNVINAAKNVVNPHCEALIKLIQDKRKEAALVSVGIMGEIVSVEVPKVLSDEMFNELIKPYSSTAEKVIGDAYDIISFVRDNLTSEELQLLIKTGSANLDAKIAEYIPNAADSSAIGYDFVDTSHIGMKQAICHFLMLTGIQNERNEKTAPLMDNPKTRLAISEWRASLGGKIFRDLDAAIREISSGAILVRNRYLINNFSDYVVYVYGVNYRKWITEKGGSPEAVLGLKATGINMQSLTANSDLASNPDEYKRVYDSRLEHAKHVAIMKDLGLVKRITRDYMTDVINNLDDVHYPAFHARLEDAMDHEYHGDADLAAFTIKVISRTLFPAPADESDNTRSDVKDLLLEVHSILRGGNEILMDHAVYLGTVRLVAKYVARQIQKQRV